MIFRGTQWIRSSALLSKEEERLKLIKGSQSLEVKAMGVVSKV
jgi:hypothetical protein